MKWLTLLLVSEFEMCYHSHQKLFSLQSHCLNLNLNIGIESWNQLSAKIVYRNYKLIDWWKFAKKIDNAEDSEETVSNEMTNTSDGGEFKIRYQHGVTIRSKTFSIQIHFLNSDDACLQFSLDFLHFTPLKPKSFHCFWNKTKAPRHLNHLFAFFYEMDTIMQDLSTAWPKMWDFISIKAIL